MRGKLLSKLNSASLWTYTTIPILYFYKSSFWSLLYVCHSLQFEANNYQNWDQRSFKPSILHFMKISRSCSLPGTTILNLHLNQYQIRIPWPWNPSRQYLNSMIHAYECFKKCNKKWFLFLKTWKKYKIQIVVSKGRGEGKKKFQWRVDGDVKRRVPDDLHRFCLLKSVKPKQYRKIYIFLPYACVLI